MAWLDSNANGQPYEPFCLAAGSREMKHDA